MGRGVPRQAVLGAVASRAIQAALRDAADRSPAMLTAVLAAVMAEGDPWRDLHPLLDLPPHPTPASMFNAWPGVVRCAGRTSSSPSIAAARPTPPAGTDAARAG